jgi:hypothetical protein
MKTPERFNHSFLVLIFHLLNDRSLNRDPYGGCGWSYFSARVVAFSQAE